MDANDLLTLRTALLITLSILLVVVIWRRFKQRVVANDMPAPMHAELLGLDVAYHPARLLVLLHVPSDQRIGTRVLDRSHVETYSWEMRSLNKGTHTLEQMLPTLPDGTYFLEMTTSTQRTVRQFRLQQA
ncbi:MAG TPA: hypothetical protein PLB89_08840 [Flavobacteriales bacterium]|nr:hypothetical protein [Flavobacteriales bacterium]